jgi:transposase
MKECTTKNPKKRKSQLFIGLDVDDAKAESVVFPERGPAIDRRRVALNPTSAKLKEYLRKLASDHDADLLVAYEAGNCGYTLQRRISSWGYQCVVVAPAQMPRVPGDRRKTNRRDAEKLAKGARAEDLPLVHIPTPEDESVRRLIRLREDKRGELQRARNRLTAFLKGYGFIYTGRRWAGPHMRWVEEAGNKLPYAIDKYVFRKYLQDVKSVEAELKDVDGQIAAVAATNQMVQLLMAFKGIGALAAVTLVFEVVDYRRFKKAGKFMAWQGLIPGEHSTGQKPTRLGITKTGNRRCRHVLVQAAWHYLRKTAKNGVMTKRRKNLPAWVIDIVERADKRLYAKYHSLVIRRPSYIAAVAVARELAGFVWDLGRRYQELGTQEDQIRSLAA